MPQSNEAMRKWAESVAKDVDSYKGGESDSRFDMGPRSALAQGPESPSTADKSTGEGDQANPSELEAMQGIKAAESTGGLAGTAPKPTAPSSSPGIPSTPSQTALTSNTITPPKLPMQEQSVHAMKKFQFPQQFNSPVLKMAQGEMAMTTKYAAPPLTPPMAPPTDVPGLPATGPAPVVPPSPAGPAAPPTAGPAAPTTGDPPMVAGGPSTDDGTDLSDAPAGGPLPIEKTPLPGGDPTEGKWQTWDQSPEQPRAPTSVPPTEYAASMADGPPAAPPTGPPTAPPPGAPPQSGILGSLGGALSGAAKGMGDTIGGIAGGVAQTRQDLAAPSTPGGIGGAIGNAVRGIGPAVTGAAQGAVQGVKDVGAKLTELGGQSMDMVAAKLTQQPWNMDRIRDAIPKMFGMDVENMPPMLKWAITLGGPMILIMLLMKLFGKSGSYTTEQINEAQDIFDNMSKRAKMQLWGEAVAFRDELEKLACGKAPRGSYTKRVKRSATPGPLAMAPRFSRTSKGPPKKRGQFPPGNRFQGAKMAAVNPFEEPYIDKEGRVVNAQSFDRQLSPIEVFALYAASEGPRRPFDKQAILDAALLGGGIGAYMAPRKKRWAGAGRGAGIGALTGVGAGVGGFGLGTIAQALGANARTVPTGVRSILMAAALLGGGAAGGYLGYKGGKKLMWPKHWARMKALQKQDDVQTNAAGNSSEEQQSLDEQKATSAG